VTCPHPEKIINGVYAHRYTPVAVSWSCTTCSTSGAIPWADATPEMRREATLAEMARQGDNEMHVWRADG
jgi:hypothetical protein